MPLAVRTLDTDCNMVCTADYTELCGAGNRLAVYVDSSAPSLDLNTCLNSVQLQATNPPVFNFDLEGHYVPAFPGAAVSVPGILGNFQLPSTPNIQILVVSILPFLLLTSRGSLLDDSEYRQEAPINLTRTVLPAVAD